MNKFNLNLPEKIFGFDSANLVLFLPLLVVLILGLMSISLVFVPRLDNLNASRDNLKSIKAQTKNVKDKIAYLNSIDQSELKQNADSLASALLPQSSAYTLVDVVRKVVSKYGFQVDSFLINPGKLDNKTTKVENNKGVSKIPIKVIIVGPKSGYLELIKSIERTLPVLSITSFKMTTAGSLSKMEMEIAAFYIEDSAKYDINKLSLSDLTLSKEENDVVTNLGGYTILEKGQGDQKENAPKFIKYKIRDPFSI